MFGFFRITPKQRKVKIRSKTGLIYHNPPISKKMLFVLSNGIFILAGIYLIYLFLPLGRAYWSYWRVKRPVPETAQQTVVYPTPEVLPIKEFRIQIPKILAEAEVVEGVSPFDRSEYIKVLENNTIAQAKGSAFPGGGKGKMVYLFAHSTQQGWGMARKNAVFYLLGELVSGDVIFVNYNGQTFTYKVYQQKILKPDEANILEYSEKDKEILLLQTCWPIGTDWKRLVIFAKKSE